MSHKNYHLVSGLIFLVIALIHVWRVFAGWEVTLNGAMVPMWLSWVAVVVTGYLAYYGLGHIKK